MTKQSKQLNEKGKGKKDRSKRESSAYKLRWAKKRLEKKEEYILNLKATNKIQKKKLQKLDDLQFREEVRKFLIIKSIDRKPLTEFEKGLTHAVKRIQKYRKEYPTNIKFKSLEEEINYYKQIKQDNENKTKIQKEGKVPGQQN